MDFEGHLLFVCGRLQLPLLFGLNDRPVHGGQPGLDGAGQSFPHRSGSVIKLNRTADKDAARLQLDCDPFHPVGKQRTNARQSTWLAHGRKENFVREPGVVLTDH